MMHGVITTRKFRELNIILQLILSRVLCPLRSIRRAGLTLTTMCCSAPDEIEFDFKHDLCEHPVLFRGEVFTFRESSITLVNDIAIPALLRFRHEGDAIIPTYSGR